MDILPLPVWTFVPFMIFLFCAFGAYLCIEDKQRSKKGGRS